MAFDIALSRYALTLSEMLGRKFNAEDYQSQALVHRITRAGTYFRKVGALPGAMPPLIGWAAASGNLGLGAWVLYAFVFLWQFPHFMAIAWMYREDYARAGYLVLPHDERRGRFMAWQSVMPLLVLVLMIPMPVLLGKAGLLYLTGASVLSCAFLCFGAQLALRKSNLAARHLLFASIIFLPLVFVLMVIDQR